VFDRGGVILGSKGLWLYDCVVLKKRYSGNTGQKDKRKAKIWVEDFKAAKRREAANSIIGIQADPIFDCHFLLQGMNSPRGIHGSPWESEQNFANY